MHCSRIVDVIGKHYSPSSSFYTSSICKERKMAVLAEVGFLCNTAVLVSVEMKQGLHKSNTKYGGKGPRPLYPEKKLWYPLNGRLRGPQSRSESIFRREKYRVPPGFEPRTVQPTLFREVNETL
jgi:hypothetical protein